MKPTPQPQWEDLVIRQAPAPAAPRRAPARQVQAAYLTHELRAPVTSIRLGLEILAEQVEGRLEADEKQMLSLAIRNTQRLESLVDDIMDYSKIAAGKMSLSRQACDARALVEEAIEALKAAALSKGIKLSKDVDPLLPRCSAESRRVVQVLINLLSNAVKYTPARGGVSVSVCEGRYEHAGTLLFRVKDSGCGIAQDELETIFGIFEQASHTGTRKTAGTGLGLTLARAMVELHGGRIWAESWKGCGATFCFTIPVADADHLGPVEAYAKPFEFQGLAAELARRLNAVLALFV